MKFESGFEKSDRDNRKANEEQLKGIDGYADFNSVEVDALLEKRRKEQEEFELREKERREKLEKLEKEGKLYIKERTRSKTVLEYLDIEKDLVRYGYEKMTF